MSAPLYFVRSGHIYLPNTTGTFRNAGYTGDEWSSRTSATDTNNAFILGFGYVYVRSSDGPYSRYHGYPLRCLSTAVD